MGSFLLIAILFFSTLTMAQRTIKGTVQDLQSNLSLEGTTIYLADSKTTYDWIPQQSDTATGLYQWTMKNIKKGRLLIAGCVMIGSCAVRKSKIEYSTNGDGTLQSKTNEEVSFQNMFIDDNFWRGKLIRTVSLALCQHSKKYQMT